MNFSSAVAIVIIGVLLIGCKPATPPVPRTAPGTELPQEPSTPSGVETPAEPVAKGTQLAVDITADGFTPKTITVGAGDTVTWSNKDSVPHWVASAMHPTHTVYPEPGGCIGSKFDSCVGIEPLQSWQFTFTHKGQWMYHDHLDSQTTGKVVVQ